MVWWVFVWLTCIFWFINHACMDACMSTAWVMDSRKYVINQCLIPCLMFSFSFYFIIWNVCLLFNLIIISLEVYTCKKKRMHDFEGGGMKGIKKSLWRDGGKENYEVWELDSLLMLIKWLIDYLFGKLRRKSLKLMGIIQWMQCMKLLISKWTWF